MKALGAPPTQPLVSCDLGGAERSFLIASSCSASPPAPSPFFILPFLGFCSSTFSTSSCCPSSLPTSPLAPPHPPINTYPASSSILSAPSHRLRILLYCSSFSSLPPPLTASYPPSPHLLFPFLSSFPAATTPDVLLFSFPPPPAVAVSPTPSSPLSPSSLLPPSPHLLQLLTSCCGCST